MSSFFLGEERVTTELLPFAIAAPSHEARAFLATQISDEAKHMVFFDRFYREVFGVDAETLSENVDAQRPQHERRSTGSCSTASSTSCAETLRKDPADMAALVRGVTDLHDRDRGHAGPHRRPLHDPLAQGARPAARVPAGLHRGEPRRVAPRGLRREVPRRRDQGRPAHKQTVQDTLQETLPVGTLALAPPMVDDPYDFETPFGYTSQEIYAYAMKSLSKKLAAMGMEPLGAAA